jgi:hypothetical protein
MGYFNHPSYLKVVVYKKVLTKYYHTHAAMPQPLTINCMASSMLIKSPEPFYQVGLDGRRLMLSTMKRIRDALVIHRARLNYSYSQWFTLLLILDI